MKTNSLPPTITSLSVNNGPYNTEVAITGTNFSTTKTDNQLFFNGVAAALEAATSTNLYARVPLSAGTGSVTIQVNGNKATGPVFTYQVSEVLTTFAGSPATTGSADGLGILAGFYQPYGMAIDASGNIYVADQANNLIRKITPAGLVTTIAGSGAAGSNDGKSSTASFNSPTGIAVDAAGNLYVVDGGNNMIRKITVDGQVSTIAGNVAKGYLDGHGIDARFNRPADLVVDANNNLYVTDLYNYRIRKITPAGDVTTFAGSGSANSKDGVGLNANFANPTDIAIDKNNNLYISQGDNLIRMITPGGVVTSIAGTVASTLTSSFGLPQGIFLDNNSNIYIENSLYYQLDKLTPNGQLSVFAGTGQQNDILGPVVTASLTFMEGIVINANGDIYISEGNWIRKITFE